MNPGVYDDLSHGDYLSVEGWVSSSQLKRHLPEFYKPFNGSASADFGTVFHQRFTGEDFPVVPVEAATWQGKAAQEKQQQIIASGGVPILTGDVPLLDGMEAAVRDHSVASTLLVDTPGVWEQSVFTDVEGVPSKARFDRILNDGTAVDIKTSKTGPRPYDMVRAVIEYGYDLQRRHYEMVGAAAGIDITRFVFVFVPKDPPHLVTVVELDEAFMDRAEVLRDIALSRYLHPEFVPAYPGEREPIRLSCPKWAEL